MMWKAIGRSVAGTSHTAIGKGCEDAICYEVLNAKNGSKVLVCCISDGAGSAAHAAFASTYTVNKVLEFARHLISHDDDLSEAQIYALAEDVYYGLEREAIQNETSINEYACTMSGCIIMEGKSAFFQVGDGAIIRDDEANGYSAIWWPQTGEYHNTTYFITDDSGFANFHVMVTDTPIHEVAIFTDGLQMLALNMETSSVHQPFFRDLFNVLRHADSEEKTSVLNRKLAEFLNSDRINQRTDDDKTLFMATRLSV